MKTKRRRELTKRAWKGRFEDDRWWKIMKNETWHKNFYALDDGWPESVEEQGLLLLVWRHNFTNNIWKICYRQSRRGAARQNSEKCKTIVCIANTFTHRRFYTQKLLHTEAFTHRSFYTEAITHKAFTHRSFYIQTLLHTDVFTHRRFYTDTVTHRHVYTQTFLHTGAAFTHKRFDTQKLLHIDAFTHRHFYTQTLLHTEKENMMTGGHMPARCPSLRQFRLKRAVESVECENTTAAWVQTMTELVIQDLEPPSKWNSSDAVKNRREMKTNEVIVW